MLCILSRALLGIPENAGVMLHQHLRPKLGPKEGLQPVPSVWGSPNQSGPSGRKCIPCISKANLKIAFWGAQQWAQMLHHTCIPGGPQQKGQNQSGPKCRA